MLGSLYKGVELWSGPASKRPLLLGAAAVSRSITNRLRMLYSRCRGSTVGVPGAFPGSGEGAGPAPAPPAAAAAAAPAAGGMAWLGAMLLTGAAWKAAVLLLLMGRGGR
jgi:hypothetical protein